MKIKFFDLARRLSKKSNHPQHKLGCVLVFKNRIVGIGFNQIKSHTRAKTKYNMLHAEISAIIGVGYKDLRNCTAYVYREDKLGNLALAKPCDGCMMALKLAGISKVFYTADKKYENLVLK